MINIVRAWWYGAEIPKDVQGCLDITKKTCDDAKIEFVLTWDKEFKGTPIEAAILKDIAALECACVEPGLLAVDADIALYSIPEIPDDGVPRFSNSICWPCVCMFAVNGNTEFFETHDEHGNIIGGWKIACERNGTDWRKVYGFPQKWLGRLINKNDVGVIPAACYIHFANQNGGRVPNERIKSETYSAISAKCNANAEKRAAAIAAEVENIAASD